jgi:hypothetical protein
VVDFVFKTFVSIITSLGYVGNKSCWQSVVDKTLSSHSHVSNVFSKGILVTGLSGSWS